MAIFERMLKTGGGNHNDTTWRNGQSGDPDRYVQTYWSRFPGKYLMGDSVMKDEDGYFWFRGRIDEVLNVAGHRLGTAEALRGRNPADRDP